MFMFFKLAKLKVVLFLNFFMFVLSASDLFNDKLYESVLDTAKCERHLQNMNRFEFIDASFRLPQSVFLGNLGHLGNYYQCLKISQNTTNGENIEGKYCMIQLPLKELPMLGNSELNHGSKNMISNKHDVLRRLGMFLGVHQVEQNVTRAPGNDDLLNTAGLLKLAVCIPKTCSVQETIGANLNALNVTYQEKYCRLPKDKVFSTIDRIAVAIFSVIGVITVLSTSYELFAKFALNSNNSNQTSKILKCCSIFTNTKRLLTFTDAPGAITCLDGIRSISILWVVIGHSATNAFLGMVINPLEMVQWVTSWDAIWLVSANLSVDTFFMMSGLLTVYTTANKLTQSSLVKNLHMFYLHRLLRMFPLLAATVLLQASIMHHVADGPSWNVLETTIQSCRKWWWSVLLHVQNYVNMTEICLPHTWYLSVDTQLHAISPLVLYWILGSRRSATIGVSFAMGISLLIAITYCYINEFSGISFFRMAEDMIFNFKYYYVNTLIRAPAFFVGMVFGYILHLNRGSRVTLPVWYICVGWAVSITLGLLMAYINHPSLEIPRFWMNLLSAIMRPVWALFLGWLVLACAHGYGGPINWFLSLTVWKFISRISYALYLSHYPVQMMLRASNEVSTYFTVTNMHGFIKGKSTISHLLEYKDYLCKIFNQCRQFDAIYTEFIKAFDKFSVFINDLAYSMLLSTIMCIVVDAPFSTLLKLVLQPRKRKESKSFSREVMAA